MCLRKHTSDLSNTALTCTPGDFSEPPIPFITSLRQVLFQFSPTGNCSLTDRKLETWHQHVWKELQYTQILLNILMPYAKVISVPTPCLQLYKNQLLKLFKFKLWLTSSAWYKSNCHHCFLYRPAQSVTCSFSEITKTSWQLDFRSTDSMLGDNLSLIY